MSTDPSGASAIAVDPMPADPVGMPVANDPATNGRSTRSNSDCWVCGTTAGTPFSASTNSGLVYGASAGGGASP